MQQPQQRLSSHNGDSKRFPFFESLENLTAMAAAGIAIASAVNAWHTDDVQTHTTDGAKRSAVVQHWQCVARATGRMSNIFAQFASEAST